MKTSERYHFVGIGGIGMSGIARILLELGCRVTGSDLRASRLTRNLEKMGAKIFIGHQEKNVGDVDAVIISSAVPQGNPEVQEAKRRGIPVLQRAEMLAQLMRRRRGIAVSGTHGKTTTTSMVRHILESHGIRPTVVIGGELNDIGSNAILGKDPYLVCEADESNASFLKLEPHIAVVTSIDADINLNVYPFVRFNFDYEKTLKQVSAIFQEFIGKISEDGRAVLCADHPNVRKILPLVKKPFLTYGIDAPADLSAEEINMSGFCSNCQVIFKGRNLGAMHLGVPGKHNILNALAAIGVALELGLPARKTLKALESFQGVVRRFQILAEVNGVIIVDDYAHNPAKIRAALQAARTGPVKRVIAVFQPHRYTRTKFLMDEFAQAFRDADILILTDIYPAGECPIVGVRSETLAEAIRRANGNATKVVYLPEKEDIPGYLAGAVRPGDIVITLGAGDIYRAGEKLAAELRLLASSRPATVSV